MMRKSNVFWDMMGWGLISGIITAQMIVMIVFWALTLGFSGGATRLEFIPLFWGSLPYGIPIGIISGVMLGFLVALPIWFILRNTSQDDIQANRLKVYAVTFMLATLGGLGMTSFVWLDALSFFFITGLFPSLIAAIILTYAAHRYLLRLSRYYEQEGKTKRKGKPKHDIQRLMDDTEDEEFGEAEKDLRQRREG